ncbi:MAG TPA: hypothetical protein VGO62_13045, partial [Myxococcota bacterium]
MLRAFVATAWVAFFVATAFYRLHAADLPYSLDGDQAQAVGHYWRYAVPGAIPTGHLISDYAFAYHSPPGWWAIMASLSALLGPLVAAKAMGVVALLAMAIAGGLLVGRRTEWLLGALVAFLIVRDGPEDPQQIVGGVARSMAPALLYLFALAFHERRHRTALVILVAQAAIYPSLAIPCGIAYGSFCVVMGPMRDRLRRCAGMLVAGALVIVLGLAQDLSSPSWWGPTVTYAEAAQMPAWGPGGRFNEVPHMPLPQLLTQQLERGYVRLGHTPLPRDLVKRISAHAVLLLVALPLAAGLALLAMSAADARARRRRQQGPAEEVVCAAASSAPWSIAWLCAASLVGYALVRVVSFKLFLPARQIGFTAPYLALVGTPWLLWYAARAAFPTRPGAALVVAVGLGVLPAFILRGDGLAVTSAGYSPHKDEGPLWQAIRALPLDDEVACDLHTCEVMMLLGQHVPFASRNLAHPLRKGYYAEVERRLIESQRVLHATSATEIEQFVAREHVHWFAYEIDNASTLDKRLFHPLDDEVKVLFDAGADQPRLLADP